MGLTLRAEIERWPIAGGFTISRGTKTEAVVVVATLTDGAMSGRGECVPYARYGETPEGVMAEIAAVADAFASGGVDGESLKRLMRPGAARNAVDCALWDYTAKKSGARAAAMAGVGDMRPLITAFTLSLGEPDAMRAAAEAASARPLLKVKLGGKGGDIERIQAVRAGAPNADLIVDANEGWGPDIFAEMMAACADVGVKLIEQPVPQDADAILRRGAYPVPICADESCHTSHEIPLLATRYDAINIKLDKAGGLTEALTMVAEADSRGLTIMVGCMLATSLAMAPALIAAQRAAFVDLDGPLLLSRDREPGLVYDGSLVHPPTPDVWG